MNDELKKNCPEGSCEDIEPSNPKEVDSDNPLELSDRWSLPIWVLSAIGLLVIWGDIYLINRAGGFNEQVYTPYKRLADVPVVSSGPATPYDMAMKRGGVVFKNICAGCHQPHGNGVPGVYPPITKSDWVLVDGPDRIIRIVLHGLVGPIEVNGTPFNNAMAALGALSDEQIADVTTFIRGNPAWGHQDGWFVSPEEVAAVRSSTGSRTTPWTAAELEAISVGVGTKP